MRELTVRKTVRKRARSPILCDLAAIRDFVGLVKSGSVYSYARSSKVPISSALSRVHKLDRTVYAHTGDHILTKKLSRFELTDTGERFYIACEDVLASLSRFLPLDQERGERG